MEKETGEERNWSKKIARVFASIDLPVFESLPPLLSRRKASENYRLGVAQVQRTGCWLVLVGPAFTYKFQPNSHYPLTDPAAQTGRRNPFETATYVTRFQICLHARHRVIRLYE